MDFLDSFPEFELCKGPLLLGRFLNRINRFVVQVEIEGSVTFSYLPNPGRLWEILLPGAYLLLAPSRGELPYKVIAAKRLGNWVMLHTHLVNDVVDWMLRNDLIAELAGAKILKREITVDKSRIDFLLTKGSEKIFLEAKSCTLFGSHVAAFPDAVTARGRKHIEKLASLTEKGYRAALLFLVNSPKPEIFVPDYHTDLAFAISLIRHRNAIDVIPVGVDWSDNMSIRDLPAKISVPWEFLEEEIADRGVYLSIFEIDEFKDVEIGALGTLKMHPGYYVYAGSAANNLTARINRHARKRKILHWHVDYLREVAKSVLNLPIRTRDDIECLTAGRLSSVASYAIPGFGSSDCSCESHLFYFPSDPLKMAKFMDMLIYFRFDRLWDKVRVRV